MFVVIQAGLNLAPMLIPALACHFIGSVNQTVIKCQLGHKSEWGVGQAKVEYTPKLFSVNIFHNYLEKKYLTGSKNIMA